MVEPRVTPHGLAIAKIWHDFIVDEVFPNTGIEPAHFWSGIGGIIARFAPINRRLVAKRDKLQREIDAWHLSKEGLAIDTAAYRAFLVSIGYLLPEGSDFCIETENVDAEIAKVAGPQLVVPLSNARFSLNAANARWGSLYDALYGSDALGQGPVPPGDYDPDRGMRVVAWCKRFLDDATPLAGAMHSDVRRYIIAMARLLLRSSIVASADSQIRNS